MVNNLLGTLKSFDVLYFVLDGNPWKVLLDLEKISLNILTTKRQDTGRKKDWVEAVREKTVVCGQSLGLLDNQLSQPPDCLKDSEKG